MENGQKNILVQMLTGSGKSIVLIKTLEMINKKADVKSLVITNTKDTKNQIKNLLSEKEMEYLSVEVVNAQNILKFSNKKISEYQFLVFDDVVMSKKFYDLLECEKKTNVVFMSSMNETTINFFKQTDLVFTYDFEQAVNDGILTPAMNPRALGFTVKNFVKQLLMRFGCTQDILQAKAYDKSWDLYMKHHNRHIWCECKTYKSQFVSPTAGNSLLKDIVMCKMKQKISDEDIVLLIIFSKIPSFQKDVIYNRYRIIVWDIDNLVFYCKDSLTLLKQLSQITYFPIEYIEGQESKEAILAKLSLIHKDNEIINDEIKENSKTNGLIQQLKCCKTGKKYSYEYEKICEEIIRLLFESTYFNVLSSQYKTKDKHFRMDLIGSLKINHNNSENFHPHPLWQMLIQH